MSGDPIQWAMSLWAGLAVLGFALVFSVPRRTLPGIVALAVAAHLLRTLMQHAGAGLPFASFVAAIAVGLTAAVISPRFDQATPIFAFAPVIPLIPGTYMFHGLADLMALTAGTTPDHPELIVADAAVNVATATLTIIALAVGTIGPTLLAGANAQTRLEAPHAVPEQQLAGAEDAETGPVA